MNLGTFPALLKKATIIPIYKSGDASLPSNYRPIALLSSISKIIEKVVSKRLIKYLESKKLLSKHQYGFRSGLSTGDATLKLTSQITSYIDGGEKCLGVFLDLQKAFDTVSTPILIARLENLGIRGVVLDWFQDFLTDRHQCVMVEKRLSNITKCSYGLPQGSTVSPILFLVYINQLCNTIPGADVIMFADDTVLLFHDKSWKELKYNTERGLAQANAWLENSLLSINTAKTKYICFSKTKVILPDASFDIKIHCYPCNRNNVCPQNECDCPQMERVTSIKYLGIHIDQNLKWDIQASALTSRIRRLIYIFRTLRSIANKDIILLTYKALCESIISYCICTWGGMAKTFMIEIERAQRAVIKVALKLNYRHPTIDVYRQAKVLSVRKLYVLNILRRYHQSITPTPDQLQKRIDDIKLPRLKSKFAQKSFLFNAIYIYNILNRKQCLKKLNNYQFKRTVIEWLQKIDYDDTEVLIR